MESRGVKSAVIVDGDDEETMAEPDSGNTCRQPQDLLGRSSLCAMTPDVAAESPAVSHAPHSTAGEHNIGTASGWAELEATPPQAGRTSRREENRVSVAFPSLLKPPGASIWKAVADSS